MKNFMAVYIGNSPSMEEWNQKSADEQKRLEQEGMAAWGKWVEANASSIVDHGAPLGKTKRISEQGISDIKNDLAAYTVVRAESHEAASKLFENHPHFTIFPGDSVQVMECLPMPQP